MHSIPAPAAHPTPKPLSLNDAFRRAAAVAMPGRRALMPRTVATYEAVLTRFYRFLGRSAASWCPADVEAFMRHLHDQGYAPKSRGQALCALVYVFKHVLKRELGELTLPVTPRAAPTIKVIPTREEVMRLLAGMRGAPKLMAQLMYGSGLRVEETCMLRVKDIDVGALTIRIHGGKGGKDRLCLLPKALIEPLRLHLNLRAAVHAQDLAMGAGLVDLPGRLASKYRNAPRSLDWQFLFPSTCVRGQRRWHAVPETVQLAMRAALKAAGIRKRITPHTLRHAYATHSLRGGNDIATVSKLLGHSDLATTAIYLHADHASGVSPLDMAA